MKKFLISLLTLMLTYLIPTYQNANATDISSNGNVGSQFTYTMGKSYTVTIPENLTHNNTFTVALGRTLINHGETIKVTVPRTVTLNNGTFTATGTLYNNNTAVTTGTDIVILQAAAGSTAATSGTSVSSYKYVCSGGTVAGTYTKEVTFKVTGV